MLQGSNILGIEIGGTKLQLLLQNGSGDNLARERFKVQVEDGANGILAQIETGIRRIQQSHAIDAVGIGFGGPIDRDSGIITQSSHIRGWSKFPLRDWAQGISGCPVFAENDANVAALGEAKRGAGIGYGSIFYVTIGSGIGGGLVKDRMLVHGRKPGESEIGLMQVDFGGGLLQDFASGWGIDQRIRASMDSYPTSVLTKLSREDPGNEARHLGLALDAGDPFALIIYEDTVKYLAWALSHVVHLIHPDAFVIGGGVSQLGDRLGKSIQEKLTTFVTPGFHPVPPVLLSVLKDDVVPVGAIELAKQQLIHRKKKE